MRDEDERPRFREQTSARSLYVMSHEEIGVRSREHAHERGILAKLRE
jgi:hypothetical protein